MTHVYIAGPMTGFPEHNFPAFHEVAAKWRALGYTVTSPAEMDDSDDHEALASVPWTFYMKRDLVALVECEAMVVLGGWEKSKGAQLEVHVARALGMPVWWSGNPLYPEPVFRDETVLQEAQRLVHGDRQNDYGHPVDDFTRSGRMWGAILGLPDAVDPALVALCMAAVKISREVNKPKRDNRTDLAGYAGALDLVRQRQGAA